MALALKRLARFSAYAQRIVKVAGSPDGEGWSKVALLIETVAQATLTLLWIGAEILVSESEALRLCLKGMAADIVHR
jgi:hypothetical protein